MAAQTIDEQLIHMLAPAEANMQDLELVNQALLRAYGEDMDTISHLWRLFCRMSLEQRQLSRYNDVDIRSLWSLAQRYSPTQFKAWIRAQAVSLFQNRKDDTPETFAKILTLFLRLKYIYEPDKKEWYYYSRSEHRLKLGHSGLVTKIMSTSFRDFLKTEGASPELLQKFRYQSIKLQILEELKLSLESEFKWVRQNSNCVNSQVLCMTNGILCLGDWHDKVKLRPGYLQDHITQTTGISYRQDLHEDHPEVLEGYRWLELYFPKPENKDQFLKALHKTIFTGNYHDHRTYVWTGGPNTGKTTMSKVVQMMFGGYACIKSNSRTFNPKDYRIVFHHTEEVITRHMVNQDPIHYITHRVPSDKPSSSIHPDMVYEIYKYTGDMGKARESLRDVPADRLIHFEHKFEDITYEPDWKQLAEVLLWLVVNHQ